MNGDENEQKVKIKNVKSKFDEFLNELQKVKEDQELIIAETKKKGESQIKEFEARIKNEEKTIELKRNEMDKIEELQKRLINFDQAARDVNSFILSEKELFDEMNVTVLPKIRPKYRLLNERISLNEIIIKTTEDNIKQINDDLQKFIETECTLAQRTVPVAEENDHFPKCEICLEKYDHNEHWQSAIVICGHQFGKSCIEKWFHERGRCPKCDKKFALENILTLF